MNLADIRRRLTPEYMKEHFHKRIRQPKGIVFTVSLVVLAIFFAAHFPLFSMQANEGSTMKLIWFGGFFLCLLFLFFTLFRYLCVVEPGKTRCISVLHLIIATLFHSAQWHFGVEIITNPKWRRISLTHNLMSIGISAALFLVLFFLFHSLKAAVGLGSLFYIIFAIAQYYTTEFRGIPILFYDILDIGAAAEVVGNYEFVLTKEILLVFYLFLLIYMNYAMSSDRVPGTSRRAKILSRLAGAAILLVMVIGIGRSKAFSKSIGTVGMPRSAFRQVGAQLCFIQTIKNAQVRAPEGYSVEKLKEHAIPFIEAARTYNANLPAELPGAGVGLAEGEQPNVIVIMDEAFADVDIYGKAGLTEKVMPNYHSLKENAIKGKVMVSTYGGGTGRSEFEYNTGGSMHLFSLSASPYVMFGQRMQYALASQMKKQGYRTVAIHPFSRTNYNRDATYAAMGFDEFLVMEPFENAEYVRDYVSDRSVFEELCDLTEETEEPLFSFAVTMQNHSGYNYEGFESTIDEWEGAYPTASQYLTLIKKTDEAAGEMIARLKKSAEKTLVVFFGDHFPSVPHAFYKAVNGVTPDTSFEAHQLFYQTPFFIWANYDIPEKDGVITSLNYLGTTTMQLAGSKLTGWQEYLLDLQKQIPAFSGKSWYGNDGLYHEHDSDETVAALLNTYDSYEYNELIDKKNTLSEFFDLP